MAHKKGLRNEIVQALRSGTDKKEIADRFGIALGTVYYHERTLNREDGVEEAMREVIAKYSERNRYGYLKLLSERTGISKVYLCLMVNGKCKPTRKYLEVAKAMETPD